MPPWPTLASHRAWLQSETVRLLEFGVLTADTGLGASWLDDVGQPVPFRPTLTWITCRMAHVYGVGHLLGVPGAAPIAERCLTALAGPLRDYERGGWHGFVHNGTTPPLKGCYEHAFVILAGATGAQAGLAGARSVLADALDIFEERFWDESAGLTIDTWDAAFTEPEPYRGINANMHSVEATLAAADVTGDPIWASRAARISAFVVDQASRHGWRIPEHYTPDWVPVLDYNDDRRDDPFKPYGATVGHGLEWARLLLNLEATLGAFGNVTAPEVDWLAAARALFDRAVADGWEVDGAPGFVYTTDWAGVPVVRDRMHWVAAEAIGAATALWLRTGEERYAERYAQWWDYVAAFVIDRANGSWHHELDPGNLPSGKVWPGKPDLYHAFQVTLFPRLPLAPTMATALSRGLLDS